METSEVEQLIKDAIPDATVEVNGDGYHYEAYVISNAFEGQSRVKRQQMVYGAVAAQIQSGALHALNIKAVTQQEAQSK